MAGPETPLALGQQGIDDAMSEATAGSMGIAGVQQPTASTRGTVNIAQPAPAQQGGGIEMQPAEYGWRVGQDDFGQKQVASIATPSGPVPVAQQGYAFPAIAARQQALAERKNNLKAAQEKAMASFDPFKGIADPADPYQTTFDQYIRDEYATKRNDMAQAGFGGDTAAFDKWVAQTPEGQMWMRTNFTMPVSAVAKENKGRVDKVATFLEDARGGKWDLRPEDYKALQEYTTLINDIGAPMSGADSRELLLKGRAAEMVISKAQYQQQFLKGFNEFAQEMPTQVTFEKPSGAGGKVIMKVADEKVFDDYIDAQAQQAIDFGMFQGSKSEAEDWMRKLIKKKYEMKVSAMDPYESVERKARANADAGGAPKNFVTASVTTAPLPKGAEQTPSGERVLIHPWQTTGDKPHKVAKASFNSTQGPVDLYAPALTWNSDGSFLIEGVRLGSDEVTRIKQDVEGWGDAKGQSPSGETSGQTIEYITTNKLGKQDAVSALANKGEMQALWQTGDPYEVVVQQLQAKGQQGMTVDLVRKNWANKEFRRDVRDAIK
jgi:hypothetical protein